MSVRKSERKTSTMEFLKETRDIEAFFIKWQNEKPKKFRHFFSEFLIKPSANAYSCVKYANSIYVNSLETKILREKKLKESIYELQVLIGQLEVIYSVYKSDVLSNGEMQNISELIHTAINLIKGVIDSDKKRYKDLY